MTQLKCNVTDCANNVSCQCGRPEIKVNGTGASSKSETACQSFLSRESSAASNCACNQSANPCLCISCSASDCAYNESGKCTSSSVSIDGASAHSVGETQCSSFKRR